MKLFQLTFIIASLWDLTHGQISNRDIPACNGVFDFYFLLDSSGSVGSAFHDRVVPFVTDVSNLYTEPDLRISIITFSTLPTVHLNLTRVSDRPAIDAGIESLRSEVTGGFTNFVIGLDKVVEQIESVGGDRASVILMLTDGFLLDSNNNLATGVARAHDTYGARIFVIGIGSQVLETQLNKVADNTDQVFIGDDFDYLGDVITLIRDAICIEIVDVVPSMVCIGTTFEIRLNGSGFTNNLNIDEVSCRFTTSNNDQYETRPSEVVTANLIVCPAPMFSQTGSVLLEVTLDGATYIGSRVSLEIDDCKTISSATPTEYCRGLEPDLIALTGSGFSVLLDQDQASCRFTTSSNDIYNTEPEPITETTIRCPLPNVGSFVGTVSLQATVNGDFYIDDVVSILISGCTSLSSAMPTDYCRGEKPSSITLTGSGFSSLRNQNGVQCRFRTSTNIYHTIPDEISDSTIRCPAPDTGRYFGSMSLQTINEGSLLINDITMLEIKDCTVVRSVSPSRWCVFDEVEKIVILGNGFIIEDSSTMEGANSSCSFRTSDDEYYVTFPVEAVTSGRWVCPLPDVNFTAGILNLQISNSYESIGSDIKITISECTKKEYIFIAGIFGGLIALALILASCLLWCLIPLITGKIVGGLPPEVREPTPEPLPTPLPPPPPPPAPIPEPPSPKPGRKWEVVDASYYGGRGAGGMKPMKVTWGGKGATEQGSKLTKAKDANVIEVVEIASEEVPDEFTTSIPVVATPPPPVVVVADGHKNSGPGCWDRCGCWDRIKAKLKRWYAVASSYRPVFTNHGTLGRHILWFPGPDIQEKLNAAEVENGLSSSNQFTMSSTKHVYSEPPFSPTKHRNSSSIPKPPQRRLPPTPPSSPPPAHITQQLTTESRENLLSDN